MRARRLPRKDDNHAPSGVDWIIVAVILLICFGPPVLPQAVGQGHVGVLRLGPAVPWWLAGLSMVATTFSSDTPNLVTDIVRRNGVPQLGLVGFHPDRGRDRLLLRPDVAPLRGPDGPGVLRAPLFGQAASVVRGFRSVYSASSSTASSWPRSTWPPARSPPSSSGSTAGRRSSSSASSTSSSPRSPALGVLIIDMIQFFVKMTAVIAAAYFAVRAVGGMPVLVEKLTATPGPAASTS